MVSKWPKCAKLRSGRLRRRNNWYQHTISIAKSINSNKKLRMDKRQSLQLYGIAVLFMLFHHLFYSVQMGYAKYCSSEYSILGYNSIIMHISWICKLCVAIFAFITGYGLFDKYERTTIIKIIIKDNIQRALRLYKKYWLVLLLFLPVCFYNGVINFNLREFILNLVGLRSSYDWPAWYILQYDIILALSPFVIWIFNKHYYLKIGKRVSLLVLFVFSICCLTVGKLCGESILGKILHRNEFIYLVIFVEGGYLKEQNYLITTEKKGCAF